MGKRNTILANNLSLYSFGTIRYKSKSSIFDTENKKWKGFIPKIVLTVYSIFRVLFTFSSKVL